MAVLAICAYLAFFQANVLLVEAIAVGVEAALVGAETLLGLAAVAAFSRSFYNTPRRKLAPENLGQSITILNYRCDKLTGTDSLRK